MASQINNGTFSFNKEELKDWSKVIAQLTFLNKDLAQLHDVETGVKYNTQIVFAAKGGLLGKAVTGCTPNAITGVTLSEKTWAPAREDFRLEHCSADVNQQDKLVNQMTKMNPDFYKILEGNQSVIGDFLVASIIERFNENLLRKIWFNDTASAIQPTGVITTGTDLGYFNTFDGLFKQIKTNIPTNSANYVAVTKNAGTTYALQALASGDSIVILKAMYAKADSRLLSSAGAKFYVTRSLYDGYLNDLEALQTTGVGNTMITENGQLVLKYRGYEVVNMEIWDRTISAYENNGTKANLPNRAVFSTPSNLKVGTLSTDDFGTVDAFYDQYHKVNVIDGVYTVDAKQMENYLTVAAY